MLTASQEKRAIVLHKEGFQLHALYIAQSGYIYTYAARKQLNALLV